MNTNKTSSNKFEDEKQLTDFGWSLSCVMVHLQSLFSHRYTVLLQVLSNTSISCLSHSWRQHRMNLSHWLREPDSASAFSLQLCWISSFVYWNSNVSINECLIKYIYILHKQLQVQDASKIPTWIEAYVYEQVHVRCVAEWLNLWRLI